MASQESLSQSQQRVTPHVCAIVPPHLLLTILKGQDISQNTRDAVQKTYDHTCKLQKHRLATVSGASTHAQDLASAQSQSTHHSIIPSHVFQAIADSDETSSEQKERAEGNKKSVQNIHAARSDAQHRLAGTSYAAADVMVRQIYDAKKSNKLPGTLLFEDKDGKVGSTAAIKDESAKEVAESFKSTYDFYKQVLKRDSIDDHNLHLIGSVHYDDVPGPPGMDNAFWDGSEMAFGDGDGEIFGTFTNSVDIIGHELTHGMTQYTAALDYKFQAGALNESVSDVFGSVIKQYSLKQSAADADWLIGEGIFLPSITNAKALRSMKAPGTAYDNPKIGKDTQPADMDGYVDLPDTDEGDNGGVHTNSGIPNRAFYLAAVAFGGNSWEKVGPLWYAALLDEGLKNVDAKTAFKVFADLTVKHAGTLYGDDAAALVTKAWTTVKVYKAVGEKYDL